MNKSYKKVIKFLTNYDDPKKFCVIGNEAVARGALEGGVRGVFGYPGTPSTEISEIFNQVSDFQNDTIQRNLHSELAADPIYFEFSINEKVALEKAIAYSIGGRPTLCVMKNVGMNVASDALMTIAYQTIGAGLVIIACDDPGCHSSSNEQDSRYWGRMASVPVFDPATPADAHSMAKDAFELSKLLKLPVIIRMTTRVDHSRGMVSYGKVNYARIKGNFVRSPQHVNVPARTSIAHQKLLDKLSNENLSQFQDTNNILETDSTGNSVGIIASGVAYAYAREILIAHRLEGQVDILKLGLIHPTPETNILTFLNRGYDRLLVLEELEPFIENELRIMAQKGRIDVNIYGKGFAGLSPVGEYSLDIVIKAISQFTDQKLDSAEQFSQAEVDHLTEHIPQRPPALCSGCPHRATYYALKLALHPDSSEVILCGDIGCFGLGALPPLQMADTLHHMGMSVSMAQGLSEAFTSSDSAKKTVALVGDGTFFHSGVTSILNAIYTRANITVIIFDNRIIGMTGLQDNPGAIYRNKYRQVDLPALLKGMGVQYVETVDPFDVKDIYRKIDGAIGFDGVSVVISHSPCVLLPEFIFEHKDEKIAVDHSLCNTCHNQADMELHCSKEVTTANGLSRAKAKLTAVEHIPANEQSCPANICNHGFFNSILSENYDEALEIVRDKMLFAQLCGDVCHRPCEFLFKTDQGTTVPIKKLKQFVSSEPNNPHDFSKALIRTKAVEYNGNRIAVIGAGPAGLSAAYDLVQTGYAVTVYEKETEAGGLLKFAIPDFRMNKAGCDYEIKQLEELGVTFKFKHRLGQEIQLDELSTEYEAVIIAVGMGVSATLDLVEKNVQAANKFNAIKFLRQFNQKSLSLKPAAKILVIGGGNSALDAARSAKQYDDANEVVISCLESRDKMPAFEDEAAEAETEGINIIPSSDIIGISQIDSEKYAVSLNTDGGMDELEFDYIITAIGQRGDVDKRSLRVLNSDKLGRIIAHNDGGHTESDNIFVAGDICSGNHNSLIGAIASGKNAAIGVRSMLEGYQHSYEGKKALDLLNRQDENGIKPPPYSHEKFDKPFIKAEMPKFDLYHACAKCDHCIENFGCPALVMVSGKVSIDEFLCTNCGLCIDVCLNDAIHWVKKEQLVDTLVGDATI